MMNLNKFYNSTAVEGDFFSFTRENASQFAKQIADDFNPIHDIDAKRFCVPGDLLFAVALSRLGLSQVMKIRFSDMVADNVELSLHRDAEGSSSIRDRNDKTYLTIETEGDVCYDHDKVTTFTQQYVAFSGTTFPHVLVPLWQQHQVMVNPNRPLVIYESMSIELEHFDFTNPELQIVEPSLTINGKRGNVRLPFVFLENGRELGHGEKRMVISGLRSYDEQAIVDLVDFYAQRKQLLAGG